MICAKCNATVTSWRVVDGATWCMRCSQDVPTHEEQIAALKAHAEALVDSRRQVESERDAALAEVARLTAEVKRVEVSADVMAREAGRQMARAVAAEEQQAADFATLSAANEAAKAENDALRAAYEEAERVRGQLATAIAIMQREQEPRVMRLIDKIEERDAEIAARQAKLAALREALEEQRCERCDDTGPDDPRLCQQPVCVVRRDALARTEPK